MARTSMGIERRWQANMVFMRGMYCAEREVEVLLEGRERDMWRIRGWRPEAEAVEEGVGAVVESEVSVALFM
jgi:hypothetical protein